MGGVDNWQIGGCPSRIELDTVHAMFGKACLEVNVHSSPYAEARTLHIFQSIFLPIKANELSVSFWLKSKFLNGGYLKAYLLNAIEDTISINSIKFIDSPEWKKYNLNIRSKSGQILYLEINLSQNSKVWLDQFEININGNPIYSNVSHMNNSISDTLHLINAISMNTIDTLSFGLLKEIKDKRIIGIGESVHGVHEMALARNKLIKYLVKNENCKLVVLEAPSCFVDSLNLYIQGNTKDEEVFNANNIDKVQFYVYSNEMFELLKWLKEFNKSLVKKVVIAGMDVSSNSGSNLAEFLNNFRDDDIVKKMIYYEQNSNSDSILEIVAKEKTHLISILNINQYNNLIKLCDKFEQFNYVYRTILNNRGRDSIMAENVKMLVEKFTTIDEKTVVCGHLMHINKLNLINSLTPSLGKRLSNYYCDNYFVVAQLVGNGKYQAFQIDKDHLNINSLIPAIDGSIEKISSHVPLESFYVFVKPYSIFKNELVLFRKQGGIPQKNQFYSGNLHRRIDAMLFLQEGSPLLFMQDKLKEYYNSKYSKQ